MISDRPLRIAVLGSPTSWYLRDIQRVVGAENALPVTFCSLRAAVDNDGTIAASGEHSLDEFDAILVRSMPPGSLEQVIFRMDVLLRCETAGQMVINPPRALETAIDKFLCLSKMQAAGFDIPATTCCQTSDDAMLAFEQLGGDVVIKPLFGGEGRGIARLSDPAVASRAFRLFEQLGSVIYLQKFIPHEGADYRLLVIGDEVLGMRRVNSSDWRTNVSLGATAEPLVVTEELRSLALHASSVVGAPICALDLLPGKDGRLYGLEVNAVPGWQALSNALSVDIAEKVVTYMQSLASLQNRR